MGKFHKSYIEIMAAQIRGRYGLWVLVELVSGNWAVFWNKCLLDEEFCKKIFVENFFFAEGNPSYPTKKKALEYVVAQLKIELIEFPNSQATLKRAKLALNKASKPEYIAKLNELASVNLNLKEINEKDLKATQALLAKLMEKYQLELEQRPVKA